MYKQVDVLRDPPAVKPVWDMRRLSVEHIGTESDIVYLGVDLVAEGVCPAWIELEVLQGRIQLAIPLSMTDPSTRHCILSVARSPDDQTGPRVAIHLHPARRLFASLELMLTKGKHGPAVELAKNAVHLLATKYQDPVGAAYGGLILERFGALDVRADWIENLARDFTWLPDGKILLAASLARSSGERDLRRGLSLLLDAMYQGPPVFAESLSLGYSLLRRWPGDAQVGPRQACTESLAPFIANLDHGCAFSLVRWSSNDRRGWSEP